MLAYLLPALLISLILNWFVGYLAFRQQTDHYTDLTYSTSFLLLIGYSFWHAEAYTWVHTTVAVFMAIWAIRLGGYLASRVRQLGRDTRFDEIRPYFRSIMGFFTMQGLGVFMISLPLLMVSWRAVAEISIPLISWLGIGLAAIGLWVEALADYQKSHFKKQAGNKQEFMQEGLYRWVRFPNYTGEILFWSGVFIITIPFLNGWKWLAILSPIMITSLLLFFSGVPYMEELHEKKYGDRADFQAYRSSTPRLFPGIY